MKDRIVTCAIVVAVVVAVQAALACMRPPDQDRLDLLAVDPVRVDDPMRGPGVRCVRSTGEREITFCQVDHVTTDDLRVGSALRTWRDATPPAGMTRELVTLNSSHTLIAVYMPTKADQQLPESEVFATCAALIARDPMADP